MPEAELAKLLEWDSDFWGIKIGRVSGDALTVDGSRAIDTWARSCEVDCLYFLARADDPKTLEVAARAGYRLVDVRVQLARPVESARRESAVRPHRAADVPELRAIARASHDNTRFFADPRFPDERCRDLYARWIEESCVAWADAVLVVERECRVAGYVTCHLDVENAATSIGLIGVAASERKRGLGGELLMAALAWAYNRDTRLLSVVTQGCNVRAQRLFQRGGFRTVAVGLWFHKWYSA